MCCYYDGPSRLTHKWYHPHFPTPTLRDCPTGAPTGSPGRYPYDDPTVSFSKEQRCALPLPLDLLGLRGALPL